MHTLFMSEFVDFFSFKTSSFGIISDSIFVSLSNNNFQPFVFIILFKVMFLFSHEPNYAFKILNIQLVKFNFMINLKQIFV